VRQDCALPENGTLQPEADRSSRFKHYTLRNQGDSPYWQIERNARLHLRHWDGRVAKDLEPLEIQL
jgi:hypothetical protein